LKREENKGGTILVVTTSSDNRYDAPGIKEVGLVAFETMSPVLRESNYVKEF